MTGFFTSSGLSSENGLIDEMKKALKSPCFALYICSDPEEYGKTDLYGGINRGLFEDAGFAFSDFRILDARNEHEAEALVARAELIILSGGHVPTQNSFFEKIRLRELLDNYDGVIMGISAGTMNSARTVYAQPEREGEAVSKEYRRFLPGLGLTEAMVLPHYQLIKDDVLDGLRLFEDIAYPDSVGRCFYVLPDGSYILSRDGREELRGEAWRLRDGVLEKFCEKNGSICL